MSLITTATATVTDSEKIYTVAISQIVEDGKMRVKEQAVLAKSCRALPMETTSRTADNY